MLKKHFRIALANAGLRQSEFARMHHITESALTQYLSGKMASQKICSIVSSFIETEFKKLKLPIPRKAA